MKFNLMHHKRVTVCLAAMVGLINFANVVRADVEEPGDLTFNAHNAIESCIITVTWDKDASSLSPQVIDALLISSGVWPKAFEEQFGDGKSGALNHMMVRLETLDISESRHIGDDKLVTLVARLVVEISTENRKDDRAKTKALLKRICDLLQESMLEFSETSIRGQHERKAQLNEELDRARTDVHRILSERQAFLDQNDSTELDIERITQELRGYERQRAKYEVDRSVSNARREAMEEQIARLTKKAKTEPVETNVLDQMRKIVKIKQEALQHLENMVQAGRASSGELNKMRVEVAMAEADLARAEDDARQQHASRMRETGGDFVIQMNHELTQMAIDDADKEAKHKATIEMIAKLKKALKVAEQYEQMGGHRLDIARDRLEDVQRNLAELEHRIATTVRPKMTIVGMK